MPINYSNDKTSFSAAFSVISRCWWPDVRYGLIKDIGQLSNGEAYRKACSKKFREFRPINRFLFASDLCTDKWFIINPFSSDIGMQAKQVSTKEIFWTVWPIHTWQSTNFEMFCFHFQTWVMFVIKFSETVTGKKLCQNNFNVWILIFLWNFAFFQLYNVEPCKSVLWNTFYDEVLLSECQEDNDLIGY